MDLSSFGLIPMPWRRRAQQPVSQAEKALALALWPHRNAAYVLANLNHIQALVRAYGTFGAFSSATQLTVEQLLQAGAPIQRLLQAGAPIQRLLQAGVTIQQLLESGLTFEQALQTTTPNELYSLSPELYFTLPSANSQKLTFDYTGWDQTLQVGSYLRARVKLWGAGGGNYYTTGGAGGYTEGWLRLNPGESLTVIVGQAGSRSGGSTYGGGSSAGLYNASGGGRSAIRRGTTELATAGGGGGSGWYSVIGHVRNAGAGGGVSGLGPQPGTQTSGTPFQASDLGGGGGWRGGGLSSGGSGYVGGLDYQGVTEAGSETTPPRANDPDRGSAGRGGDVNNYTGGHGRVVVELSGVQP